MDIDISRKRADLYSLFSRLFIHEIDDEVLQFLKERDLTDIFPNFYKWSLSNSLSNKDLIEKHLNVDYTNIAILHLIPYETFYTREDQMIETGGANPVTDYYYRYGYKVEFEVARVVSPDHIGVELEFMSKLVEAETKALESNDIEAFEELRRTQKEFIEKHLVNFSMYLINMKYESRTPLYHDLAESALAYILEDFEYLNGEVSDR